VWIGIEYKGITIDKAYRLDFLVGELVVVELKAVDCLTPIDDAQLLTYLRLGGWPVGLLMNFNVPILKEGIRRRVLNLAE
jgi:GxxExxY protein